MNVVRLKSKTPRSKDIPCSICGVMISAKFNNNARPVNDGRCCDDCNAKVVIPRRIAEYSAFKELN
jgi:hypothetical protein